MVDDIKHKVFLGVFWRLLERFGAQIVSFAVSVILSRLLSPGVYGEISLVMIIANILQVFVDSGFGNALIQKKDADAIDFSTVFYFNMAACIFLYIVLFCTAPFIARFYELSDLSSAIRIVGLIIVISGVKNVQQAYVSRNMLFKKFFFSTLAGTITAAVIAIAMAFRGLGIWSLTALYVINPFIDTIILWITVKWRPQGIFSIRHLKELFSYGWKLFVVSIITELFNGLRELIIGKAYTTEHLAYYNNGNKIPQLLTNNIDAAIRSVLFPALSGEQENRELVKIHMLKSIKLSHYIILPILFGLAACANQIIIVFLTEKWIRSVPYLQIMCLILAMNSIQAANQQAVLALGYSDTALKMEFVIKCVSLSLFLLAIRGGVMAIALSTLISTIIAMFINLWPNRRLLQCTVLQQFKNIMPEVLLSVVMFTIVFGMDYFVHASAILTLLIKIMCGISIYFLGSIVFKMSSFCYTKELLQEILSKGGR